MGTLASVSYPSKLQELLQYPVLNLAFGGTSAEWYSDFKWDTIGHLVRNASKVIVQIMSGRSACTSLKEVKKDWTCQGTGFYTHKKTGKRVEPHHLITDFHKSGQESLAVALCQDLRTQGIRSYLELFDKIVEDNPYNPKIILTYLSRRIPGNMDDTTYEGCSMYMDGSPILVDLRYIEEITKHPAVEGVVPQIERLNPKCGVVACHPVSKKLHPSLSHAINAAENENLCKDNLITTYSSNGGKICTPDEMRKQVSGGADLCAEEDQDSHCAMVVYNYDYPSATSLTLLAYKLYRAVSIGHFIWTPEKWGHESDFDIFS